MMDTSIDLELAILHRFKPDEKRRIRTFFDDTNIDTWHAIAPMRCAWIADSEELSFTQYAAYRQPLMRQETNVALAERGGEWFPNREQFKILMRSLYGYYDFPRIDLELDLARTHADRLTLEERSAISRCYYYEFSKDFIAAQNIVLLHDDNQPSGQITVMDSITTVSPQWLDDVMDRDGATQKTILKKGPARQLLHAALIRATH
jgi:hypothetical protein